MSNKSVFSLAYSHSLPVITSIPNLTSAAQYIFNDTSLAALTPPNNDRQLSFQDNNGSIRRAIFTASANQWTISSYFDLSANSKKHTPLVATVYNTTEASKEGAKDTSSTTVNVYEMYRSHSR